MRNLSLILGAVFLLAQCGSSSNQADAGGDASPEGSVGGGRCGLGVAFGAPVLVSGITTSGGDGGAVDHFHATLTADETQIVFSAGLPASLYLAERPSSSGAFGAPIALTSLNTGWEERGASLSGDGLTLYYDEDLTGSGTTHVYSATRAAASDTTFAAGQPLTAANGTGAAQLDPSPTPDGQVLYFVGGTGPFQDHIYRALASNAFGSPSEVSELATATGEGSAVPTADDQGLYYAKFVGGANFDIWLATRPTPSGAYTNMAAVAGINSNGNDQPSWVSPDGCRIYFFSDRDGAYQLYSASKP